MRPEEGRETDRETDGQPERRTERDREAMGYNTVGGRERHSINTQPSGQSDGDGGQGTGTRSKICKRASFFRLRLLEAQTEGQSR